MSKIQLSFVHDGERYVTLFGCSEYLKGALLPNSNVALIKTVMSSSGFTAAFNQISDYHVREVPIVENASIEKAGEMFIVNGEAEIGDTRCAVSITETGVVIDTGEPESEPTPEPVSESEPTPPVVEEQIQEAPIPEPEAPKEEPEPKPEPVNESSLKVAMVGQGKQMTPLRALFASDMKNKGLIFSDKPVREMGQFLIGGTTNNDAGFYVHGQTYQPNIQKNRDKMVQQELSERAKLRSQNNAAIQGESPNRGMHWSGRSTGRNTPEHKYTPIQENYDQRFQDEEPQEPPKPKHDMPLKDYFNKSANPNDGVSKDTVEESRPPMQDILSAVEALHNGEVPVEQKPAEEVKQQQQGVPDEGRMNEILQNLDPEIAKVLPEVPISIMQSITEFTLKPVDLELLQQRGHVYCIDNRWHKCGTWFCIDYVDEANRYFYESKRGIIFALPFNICKDWVAANGC